MKTITTRHISFIFICLYIPIVQLYQFRREQREVTPISNIILNPLYPNTTFVSDNNQDYGQGLCSNLYNCFLPYGICLNSTTCMCMPDYANYYKKGVSVYEMFCSYKKKKVIVAGLLELFLPLGLGHYYAGHYVLGLIKFSYNFIIYSMGCILYWKGFKSDATFGLMGLCILLGCLTPLWNIVDLFLFFTGYYRDGNGVKMT